MTDDRDLQDLDPYDLMDAEAARLDAYFSGLDPADWAKPSRCEGWSVRDLLAHLASSEDYNHASLEGTVGEFLASWGEKGATDLTTANEIGIRSLDDCSTDQLIADWRVANAETRPDLHWSGDSLVVATAYADEGHYLHVYVSRLRRKLAAADPGGGTRDLIVAEPGVGYRIAEAERPQR